MISYYLFYFRNGLHQRACMTLAREFLRRPSLKPWPAPIKKDTRLMNPPDESSFLLANNKLFSLQSHLLWAPHYCFRKAKGYVK